MFYRVFLVNLSSFTFCRSSKCETVFSDPHSSPLSVRFLLSPRPIHRLNEEIDKNYQE